MIAAKELRIGNYINDAFGGMVVVRGVTSKGIWIRDDGFPASEQAFSGIALTEKWLIDLGIEKIDDQLYWLVKDEIAIDSVMFCAFAHVKGNNYVPIVDRLRYVHKLQNLYVDLTGKELEINTDKQ